MALCTIFSRVVIESRSGSTFGGGGADGFAVSGRFAVAAGFAAVVAAGAGAAAAAAAGGALSPRAAASAAFHLEVASRRSPGRLALARGGRLRPARSILGIRHRSS